MKCHCGKDEPNRIHNLMGYICYTPTEPCSHASILKAFGDTAPEVIRCPECREWFERDDARKALRAGKKRV